MTGHAQLIRVTLLSALADPSENVRRVAADVLTRAGEIDRVTAAALLPLARRSLHGEQWSEVRHGCEILTAAPRLQYVHPVLTASLASPDPRERDAAVVAVGELGANGAPAVPRLVALLAGADASEDEALIATLAKIGPAAGPAVAMHLDRIRNRTSEGRWTAALTLPEYGSALAGAPAALHRGLRDPDPLVRWAVVRALREPSLPPDALASPVIRALRDPVADVRIAAIHTAYLRQLTGRRAVARAVRVARSDPSAAVREAAAIALGTAFGPGRGH